MAAARKRQKGPVFGPALFAYAVEEGFFARPAWVDGRRRRARYPTRSSVRLATTVGGGVLGAPRSDYCRAALDAAVWLDRQHPRHPRRTCLHSPPHESNPAGAARAPFFTGAPTSSFHQRREGVEALPYGRHPHLIRAARNPSVTARSAATAPLSGEPRGGVRRTHVSVNPRREGVEALPYGGRGGFGDKPTSSAIPRRAL